ncbi:hypothetical protein [Humibacter ginsengisoli]
MGGQTRYDRDLGRRIERSVNTAVTRPRPISLTDAELDLEHARVVEADSPIPVRAFVRFHEAVIRPEGEAIAWTPRAVKVHFTMVDGSQHVVWVWASAVDRL